MQPKEYKSVEISELAQGILKMRDEPLSDEQEKPKVESKSATVGSRLREERLSKGIRRAEVAERLHITNHYVKALESNSFDKLPSAIFVKGYLKNYAELLKLNPTEIIGMYEKSISQNADRKKANMPSQRLKIRNKYFVVLSVIFFIVFFTTLWLYKNISVEDSPSEPFNGTTFNEVQEFQFATTPSSKADFTEDGDELIEESNNRPIDSSGDNGYSHGKLHKLIDFNSRGTDNLDILFSYGSWIEIMDAPKINPFREMMTAGDTLQVRGDAPFYILVADAKAARIRFNGVEIEVRDKIRIDNSANLILGM